MRRFILAATIATLLTGCAIPPEQFAQSVNNAVDNVQTASVASVSIGTDIIRAVVALVPAILDVVNLWHK